MTEEKKAELLKRFPFIDAGCKINFGDGWAKIIMGFCGAVRYLSAGAFRITELESRDGKLNIEYANDRNNSVLDKAVAHVEIRSTHACEHCGQERPANRTASTLIWRISNRGVRLCRECVDRYETQKASGREVAFKI